MKAVAAALAVGAALALPGVASAQGTPCVEFAGASCQTVTVPLDRSGAQPGTVDLTAARVPAKAGPARGTILFLAGGPGQAALPVLRQVSALVARYAPNYDLVTFDQRGIGRSSPLRCSALGGSGSQISIFARCGEQLGGGRGFYRSSDSADDIEAVRRAFGSPALSLYGVSYGGRVAAEYVRRYPASVQRLVLDSPSTLEGTDPFSVQTQKALPRVLSAVCARGACRSFTRRPYTDMARLASRLTRRSLRTSVITATGRRVRGNLSVGDLFALTLLTDIDPVARAELPGAVRAARSGDGGPLARALVRAVSAIGGGSRAGAQSDDIVSNEVFAATTCAEAPLPWQASSPVDNGRVAALRTRLRQLGSRSFRPFSAPVVLADNPILEQCLRWPAVNPPARAPAAGPNVPTLVVSGQEDLRTPLANAQRLAAGYPGGRVLQIPGVGHSALSTDRTACAARATFGFLTTGTAPASCRFSRQVKVAPRAPLTLGRVGGSTRRKKVVRSVELAVRDVARSFNGSSANRFGGLRGGRAVISSRGARVRLLGYQYIPGVRIDGTLRRSRSGRLVGTVTVRGRGVPRTRVTRTAKSVRAASASSSVDAAVLARPQRPAGQQVPGGVSRWVLDAAR